MNWISVLDWGTESVRRPHSIPFEILGYSMPRSPAGEMAIAICLRDYD